MQTRLEKLLNERINEINLTKVKLIIPKDAKCPDRTCNSRGYYVRCYLTSGKDGCGYFMLKYRGGK